MNKKGLLFMMLVAVATAGQAKVRLPCACGAGRRLDGR